MLQSVICEFQGSEIVLEKFSFAIEVLVIGFSVVMVALIALYGLLHLFSLIFYRNKKETVESKKAIPQKALSQEPKSDGRITAAITAAVYQYIEGTDLFGASGGFKITIQPERAPESNNWIYNGRKNILQGRSRLESIRRNKKRENI